MRRGVGRHAACGFAFAQACVELGEQPGNAVLRSRVSQGGQHLPDQLGQALKYIGVWLDEFQNPARVARCRFVPLGRAVLQCTRGGTDDRSSPVQQVPEGWLFDGGVDCLGAVDDRLALLGGVDLALGDALDGIRQAVECLEAGVGGIAEDAGQFGFGALDKGFDFAHQRGAEVADHEADHGFGKVAFVFLQLLPCQEQHRA
ncbi:hypothetical protein D3C80_1402640 [compost metagenome]